MTCRAEIFTATQNDVIPTPIQAIQVEEDLSAVKSERHAFVVHGSRAARVNVEVGLSDDTYQEVKTGLADTDDVIVGPDRVLRALKDGDRVIVKKKGEISVSGHTYPDASNQCRPYNPPFTLAMQLGLEMLQKKDGVTMIYDQDDQVRRVRLNASHPAKLTPSPMGDSIGHYEGDTLVVDTVGIKPGPYAMVDRYGSPVTGGLHVVERYRLIDGTAAKAAQERYEKTEGRLNANPRLIDPDITKKGLQVTVTVEDPNVFTTTWSGTVTYRPESPNMTWLEQVCAENPNEYYKDRWIGLPKADRPDF